MTRKEIENSLKKGFVWGCNDNYSDSYNDIMEVTLTTENHGYYSMKVYIGGTLDNKIRYDDREGAIDSYMDHINKKYETVCFYNEPCEQYS